MDRSPRKPHKRLNAKSAHRLLLLFLIPLLLYPRSTQTAEKKKSTQMKMNPAAFEHFVNGDLYELSQDIESAVREYEKARDLQPDVAEIRKALAEVYYRGKRIEAAKRELLEIQSKDAAAYSLLADCYRATGQVDSVIWALSRAVQLDSMDLNSWWRLAESWQIKGDAEKVIFYLKKLTSLQTMSVPLHLQLAGQLFQAQKYDEAISEYQRVLDLSPNNAKALLELGQSYEAKGDFSSAIQPYRYLLEQEPGDRRLRDKLVALYLKTDRIDEAVALEENASDFGPVGGNFQKKLGVLYLVQGDFGKAESLFVEYNQQNPFDAETHFHLGRIALWKEELNRAKVEFQTAVSLEDSVPDGWINLAVIYLRQDSTEMAIRTLEQGLDKTYDDTELLFRLGSVYAGQRQYDTALAILRRASDKNPHDQNILFSLGSVYEQSGDFDRSIATFERLLRINPEHASALNYLGYMLADEGIRLDESLEMIRKALEYEPDNGAYLDSYGWVLYRLGRMEEAEFQLKNALEKLNTDPIIYEHLGDVYQAVGEPEKARQQWQKASELDPDNQELKRKLGTSE
jgi:tetratricopeptide (TPR) repeat protein